MELKATPTGTPKEIKAQELFLAILPSDKENISKFIKEEVQRCIKNGYRIEEIQAHQFIDFARSLTYYAEIRVEVSHPHGSTYRTWEYNGLSYEYDQTKEKNEATAKLQKLRSEIILPRISAETVMDYLRQTGSENLPEQQEDFLEEIKKEVIGKTYVEKHVKIADILQNDPDVADFVNSEESTGFANSPSFREIERTILISRSKWDKSEVVRDGYWRVLQAYKQKQETIKAFVPIDSETF